MAPVNRSDKLKRLVNVQRHIEKMAESDLAETSRQRQEVAVSMDDAIYAIGSMESIHRAFAGHYSERFGRLMIKDQQLAGMQQLHEMRVMKERAKGDRLEDNMLDARTLEDREAADNEIYDLVDQTLAAATPASSKLRKP